LGKKGSKFLLKANLDKEGIILPEFSKPLASYITGVWLPAILYMFPGNCPCRKENYCLPATGPGSDNCKKVNRPRRLAVINCLAVLKSCLTD
jgi:hypothetical protein